MSPYSLTYIKQQVDEMAARINAPENVMPAYGAPAWDAQPYIEIDNLGLMYYVVMERGNEIERKVTDKIDDLLYWIFAYVTFCISVEYELHHRIEDKDCRRIMFAKQEELLGQINEAWRQRERAEHQEILKTHPSDDLAGLRADFSAELRKQGHTEMEIEQLVYEKYPKHGH